MVSQRDKKAIKQLEEDIKYFGQLSETSSAGEKEKYKNIVEGYKIELQSLESKIEKQKPKSVKVIKKSENDEPVKRGRLVKNTRLFQPKGVFSVDQFEKPVLSVSISSVDKRNLYDAIRADWIGISESRIEQLVEEKGYVVGVINKIIHGVVQVEDFEMYPIREDKGETTPRVGFIGKLISNHPSIHCTLKEKTDSGPTQGFNFKEE